MKLSRVSAQPMESLPDFYRHAELESGMADSARMMLNLILYLETEADGPDQWVQTYQMDLVFTAQDGCRDWLVSVHALPKDPHRYDSVDLYEVRYRLAAPWSNGIILTETLADTTLMIIEGLNQAER